MLVDALEVNYFDTPYNNESSLTPSGRTRLKFIE